MKPRAYPLITDEDLYLFNEGTHYEVQDKLGGHLATRGSETGAAFSLWAPNAAMVSVIGSFNGWKKSRHRLARRGESGIWEGFIPGVKEGDAYKYHLESKHHGYKVDKTDPFGRFQERPPRTASILCSTQRSWADEAWMSTRRERHQQGAPMSIYEVHLGSWMRSPTGAHLSYKDLAPRLIAHVNGLGFTHVQLLPITEHPFYGTWGYGTTGYFAPTSRYGRPEDLMFLIDALHQAGLGVLLDWVPAHFPADEAALGFFDGTWLFEHADPRKGHHPDWNTKIYNYGRPEVRSFLISSAVFWIERFHIDGLRVDAVASMLYLDYSRGEGGWEPNRFGGRENLEAIDFLKRLNTVVLERNPDVHMIAEESTSWPKVSHPVADGGLGFTMKWDMGWMHDTLDYMQSDPVFRKGRQNTLTFRQLYANAERFVLPLSHDEVVHGKRSLLGKMPGDAWQKHANLRLLYCWMYAQPGKKLLFMGAELAQWKEWNHESELDWALLEQDAHEGQCALISQLNGLYRNTEAMAAWDFDHRGFEWIDCSDADFSVFSLIRRGPGKHVVVCVFHFTPLPRDGYRIGVPGPGTWTVVLNSDDPRYGGSDYRRIAAIEAEAEAWHGRSWSIVLDLPPLGAVFLVGEEAPKGDEPAPPDNPPERPPDFSRGVAGDEAKGSDERGGRPTRG